MRKFIKAWFDWWHRMLQWREKPERYWMP